MKKCKSCKKKLTEYEEKTYGGYCVKCFMNLPDDVEIYSESLKANKPEDPTQHKTSGTA